ncbi:hypothetical protein [Alteromonas aestuariivivens]|nr:hypothetical protein [Alteromonas aestuariivivens]
MFKKTTRSRLVDSRRKEYFGINLFVLGGACLFGLLMLSLPLA